MPTTSSLLSPITGKRECLVSMISGMKSGGSSSIDTQSICARGIMMSRTVVSDTASTPSIIDSASASSSRRSNAPRSRSSSSSRSSGSRVRSAESRSSSVGCSSAFVVGSSIRCVRRRAPRTDRDSPAARGAPTSRASIRAASARAFVIVALQVQHAVDDEVRADARERLPCARASRVTTGTHSTMSPASGTTSSYTNVRTFVA